MQSPHLRLTLTSAKFLYVGVMARGLTSLGNCRKVVWGATSLSRKRTYVVIGVLLPRSTIVRLPPTVCYPPAVRSQFR